MAESQGTEAARVADVQLFTDGPDYLGVTAIAHRLELSKAVVHRIPQLAISETTTVPARVHGGCVHLDQVESPARSR